jgi:hypothetical protein
LFPHHFRDVSFFFFAISMHAHSAPNMCNEPTTTV